jgi:HTH-type transcriptional regulator / antitoxin HipB
MKHAHTLEMAALGKGIQKQRKSLGLSQAQLATFAGCGKLFIVHAENGKETLRIDKLLDVLKVLGLQLKLQPGKSVVKVAEEITHAD